MAVTIKKMKQPSDGYSLNKGRIFYRVKMHGETVQDYLSKRQAVRKATILRRKLKGVI
jgi:hypothetical protein